MFILFIIYYDSNCGYPIFIFHYIYELLEHNTSLSGKITKYFAVGQFHLEHHRKANTNFGFTITLWDHLFGTYENPVF